VTVREIIDRVYEDNIEQAARMLFQELMIENGAVRQETAERRFKAGLKAAAAARERARILIS
jgi:hypothetical protein